MIYGDGDLNKNRARNITILIHELGITRLSTHKFRVTIGKW